MDSNFHKLIIKTKQEDKGFVLITALMVIFLVIAIVTTVALVTASDLRASAKSRAIVTTQFMSESVADAVFASIAREDTQLFDVAKKSLAVDPLLDNASNNPFFSSSPASSNFGGWFFLDPNGEIHQCINDYLKETCFKAKLTQDDANSLILKKQEIKLEVIARGGCIVDGSTVKNCVYRKFTQIFRTKTYIENVSIYDNELNPLSPTYKVAYISSDKLADKIQSNDDGGFFYCGTPGAYDSTKPPVFNNETPSAIPLPVADCVGSLPLGTGAKDLFLPSQINNLGRSDVAQSQNIYKALAGGTTLSPFNIVGDTTIELLPAGLKIGGADQPYPSNGVIFVNGNITSLKGTYSRALTIAATGNITVTGNIELVGFNGESGTLSDDDSRILGVTTSSDIILKCKSSADTTSPCDSPRHMVGVLSAPQGTIYNNLWDKDAPAPSNPALAPRFYLYGSLIAKDHPIFGSYTSVSNAQVTNGWAKTLRFDKRLEFLQSPYFFRTTQATVVRSALEISACNSSVCRT